MEENIMFAVILKDGINKDNPPNMYLGQFSRL
jgi:hypothetical protein